MWLLSRSSQFILLINVTTSPVTARYKFSEGFAATPPCLCACVTYSRLSGQISLWKYPHLQAVLCLHQLTACLSGISSCWKHHNKRGRKKVFTFRAQRFSDSPLLPSQILYVQAVLLLKAFPIRSFIGGTTERVYRCCTEGSAACVCPCDSCFSGWSRSSVNQVL